MLPLLRLLLGQRRKSYNSSDTPKKIEFGPNRFTQLDDSRIVDERLLYKQEGKVHSDVSTNNIELLEVTVPQTGINVRSNIHWESYTH